jgi:hypothetical protein
MSTETNQEVATKPESGEGDGMTAETISVTKQEYEELIGHKSTVGSLKRDLKDAQKALEETKKSDKTPQTNQPVGYDLVQKTYLRAAGITAEDEVELALSTAKKWGIEIDKIVDDEDFKVKLDKLRTQKSNEVAVSNVRGGQATTNTKHTPAYWQAKGTLPTPADVPDRKTRMAITKSMMATTKQTGKFYNE